MCAERRRDAPHDARRERLPDVDDDDRRGGRAERDPERSSGRVERHVPGAGADLEAVCDAAAAQVDDSELAMRGVGHEGGLSVGGDRGVARLAESAQDASYADRRAIEQRHRALRGMADERAGARARLDAARAVERRDAPHDAPALEVDDGDEAVDVGRHERERRAGSAA